MVLFSLITGFLGSGKTTLLSNLLKELSGTKRIAVIQNEFAPTGVDGKELQQNADGFKLLEINNGSVFCVCQLNNFEQTIQKLLDEYEPEHIFLEASGLADPISIAELLQIPSLENRVRLDRQICLVDAANFFKGLNSLVRFKHQIMISDIVILNKTDLYAGNLEDIENSISELNPYTEIIPTTYAKVGWQKIFEKEENIGNAAERYRGKESAGRPDMKAVVLRLHDKITEESLKRFVQHLQPSCVRIKGFVNLENGEAVLIQSVFSALEVKTIKNYAGPTEIVVFGNNIQVGELRKKYKAFAEGKYGQG